MCAYVLQYITTIGKYLTIGKLGLSILVIKFMNENLSYDNKVKPGTINSALSSNSAHRYIKIEYDYVNACFGITLEYTA